MYTPIVFLLLLLVRYKTILSHSSLVAWQSRPVLLFLFLVGINHSHEPQTDPTRLRERERKKTGQMNSEKQIKTIIRFPADNI
jgi:hypothetical protein